MKTMTTCDKSLHQEFYLVAFQIAKTKNSFTNIDELLVNLCILDVAQEILVPQATEN
jgi:hypothetical protein